MSTIEVDAADLVAPHINRVAVVSVGTASARTDLSAALQLGDDASDGLLTILADGGDVYFFLNDADAGTVDETATTGANRCFVLFDGQSTRYRLRKGFVWLVHKGTGACVLRIYRSSARRVG